MVLCSIHHLLQKALDSKFQIIEYLPTTRAFAPKAKNQACNGDNTVKLANKTAILTGAASGIGIAVARRYLQEGASCLLVDLKLNDELQALQQAHPQHVACCKPTSPGAKTLPPSSAPPYSALAASTSCTTTPPSSTCIRCWTNPGTASTACLQ
jgi:3-oxoacyl-ACP reductase-like protein